MKTKKTTYVELVALHMPPWCPGDALIAWFALDPRTYRLPVQSAVGRFAEPPYSIADLVYQLDLDALTGHQLATIYDFVAKRNRETPANARRRIKRHGLAVIGTPRIVGFKQ